MKGEERTREKARERSRDVAEVDVTARAGRIQVKAPRSDKTIPGRDCLRYVRVANRTRWVCDMVRLELPELTYSWCKRVLPRMIETNGLGAERERRSKLLLN